MIYTRTKSQGHLTAVTGGEPCGYASDLHPVRAEAVRVQERTVFGRVVAHAVVCVRVCVMRAPAVATTH